MPEHALSLTLNRLISTYSFSVSPADLGCITELVVLKAPLMYHSTNVYSSVVCDYLSLRYECCIMSLSLPQKWDDDSKSNSFSN